MSDKINILLEANYHKGVSDGMLKAYQMIQENTAIIERTQDSAEGEEE